MARNWHAIVVFWLFFVKSLNTLSWLNNIGNPRESVYFFQQRFRKKMARNWHEIDTRLKNYCWLTFVSDSGVPFLRKIRISLSQFRYTLVKIIITGSAGQSKFFSKSL